MSLGCGLPWDLPGGGSPPGPRADACIEALAAASACEGGVSQLLARTTGVRQRRRGAAAPARRARDPADCAAWPSRLDHLSFATETRYHFNEASDWW